MKKITMLVFVICFIGLLYGCCSHSSNPLLVKPAGDTVITSREVIIDELGRMPAVVFPSGAKIEASEENTLTPGIVVSLVEKKISYQNTDFFNDSSIAGGVLYKITAYQNQSTPAGQKIYVTTTEKPFKITLPMSSDNHGVVLAGIRESDTDPWRFFNFSNSNDDLSAGIAEIRASAALQNSYTFNLFRLGTQIVLIAYDDNTGNKLPESIVSSLVASSTTSILVKEGKYIEDMQLKGVLKGLKLDSIKPSDLRARITYRNNQANEAPIKLNGARIIQTNKADKTVPGYAYAHSFVVDNVLDSSMLNTSGDFDFTINLNGVGIESFPSSFLVEFYNKVESEKILPYNYTEFYTINRIEFIDLTLISDEGNLADENNNLYLWNPTFTLKCNYEFSDTDKKSIANAISVSNVDSEKIVKTWNGNNMTLSFSEPLLPNTSYTISMTEVTNLEKAVVSPFKDFTFTTIYQYCSYSVVHQQENINDSSYTVFETETLKAVENSEVTPSVKTYKGFVSPVAQTITLASGIENKIVYNYGRKVSNLTITKGLGIADVNGDGSYKYGADVVASYSVEEGYVFTGWTGDMTESTFSMPDHDVSMQANASKDTFLLTLNKGAGIAEVIGGGTYDFSSDVIASCTLLAGYEFDKWIDANGNEVVATFTMPAKNVTMTANAKLIDYSITYNNLEGSNFTTANPTVYNITSTTITLNNPTRTSCDFIGWSGTGLTGSDTTIVTIPNNSIGNREYTANWNLNLSLTIASNPGCIIDEEKQLFYTLASFTVTPVLADGAIITDSEKANILEAVFVKDAGDNILGEDILNKSWKDGKIALTFSRELEASSTYTISCDDSISGVTLSSIPSLTFKTFYCLGKGNEQSPFDIENPQQFDLVRNYSDKSFRQTEDISLVSFTNWIPISFSGNYDGNGKKITNFTINTDQSLSYAGLFGYNSGILKNITINGFSITVDYEPNTILGGAFALPYIGVIAGYSKGEIIGCSVIGNNANGGSIVKGKGIVGGICGRNVNHADGASIISCHVVNSTIQSDSKYGGYVGGISGDNSGGDLISCYVIDSNIQNYGQSSMYIGYAGGISGDNNGCGRITSCYVLNSTIEGNSQTTPYSFGGICGCNDFSAITSCYIYEDELHPVIFTGNGTFGQICGLNSYGGIVSDSFSNKTGDIIGFNNSGTINNCFENVTNYSAFTSKAWSDSLSHTDSNSVWKNYNISESNWPPELKTDPSP